MRHTLYMSLRSPFARRVRLTLEELGLEYDTEVLDVFNPPASFLEVNPLGRVPALRLPNQEVLVDSWSILEHLRAQHGHHPLFLFDGGRATQARSVSGLAVGLMEHAVMHFLEGMRGPGQVSHVIQGEHLDMVRGALAHLEDVVRGQSAYALGSELRLCDLDLGAALAYADLRLGRIVQEKYPELRAYLARLNERASFKKTAPPA